VSLSKLHFQLMPKTCYRMVGLFKSFIKIFQFAWTIYIYPMGEKEKSFDRGDCKKRETITKKL